MRYAIKTLVALIFGAPLFAAAAPRPDWASPASSNWPGWSGIDFVFAFGDSYTSSGWDAGQALPSPALPFGYPVPGGTSLDGNNWIEYLTTSYNQGYIGTINLAQGGATTDNALAKSVDQPNDLVTQVNDFLTTYGGQQIWKPSTTLFAWFVGINDLGYTYEQQNFDLNQQFIDRQSQLTDQLYASGARNFLFLGVPPMDRSPFIAAGPDQGSGQDPDIANAMINDYNGRLTTFATNLQAKYADVTVFLFDTHALFEQLLDDVSANPKTATITSVNDFCPSYWMKASTAFDPSCGKPVNAYFWVNDYHPTYPVHDAMAAAIAQLLS